MKSAFYIGIPSLFGLKIDIRGVSFWSKSYLSIYGLAWMTRFDASVLSASRISSIFVFRQLHTLIWYQFEITNFLE